VAWPILLTAEMKTLLEVGFKGVVGNYWGKDDCWLADQLSPDAWVAGARWRRVQT